MQPVGIPGNWSLAFDDEFNAPENWGTTWANTRGNTNDVTTSASNVSVSGGTLNLSLSSSGTGAAVTTEPFNQNGGPGASQGFELVPGEVAEARILFPANGRSSAGNCVGWGAFWTNGNNWPTTGESDIVEEIQGDATSNYHVAASEGSSYSSPPIPSAGSWCGSWHTYAIYRQTNGTNLIYFDGRQVESIPAGTGQAASAPQGLILNIGNGMGDGVPSSYPATMNVDYVRVWRAQTPG